MAMAEHEMDHDPKEQPLISHLIELRDRILRSLLVVLVIFVVLFPFANQLYVFVSAPLNAILPEGSEMIITGVTAPFMVPFKLALMSAIFIGMPFILHQAWAFIAPGLYRNEIRVAFPILVSSIILFYVGILFAYYVVLPYALMFFVSSAPETAAVMTDIGAYLDFVLTFFFAFGLVFEIPVAILLLISAGVTTPQSLAAKRRYIVVGCFAAAIPLTPADPFTQSMLAIPMWLLFEAALLAGRFIKPREEKKDEEEAQS